MLDDVQAARELLSGLAPTPRVGLVLGSGLGGFAERLLDVQVVSYSEIPNMPVSRVPGHSGQLWLGRVGDVPVVCMQGRVHAYEGHASEAVTFGVRLMAALGIEAALVTNAAGGLAGNMRPGDLMFISDHLNLTGGNPLTGPNDPALGPRFLDMTDAYDRRLLRVGQAAAAELGQEVRVGVYAGVLGPSYETPAEVRMLATLGASAVGMSTVWEVIALRHRGVAVGGISCITNLAAGLAGHPLSHAEVQEVADLARERFTDLLWAWTSAIPSALTVHD